MFPKRGKQSTTEIARLRRRLDTWFSRYIRLRDQVSPGIIQCITCGRPKYVKEAHAGHYQNRRWLATRYHEKNVHAQCPQCNTYDEGRAWEHGQAIDRKYGKGTAETIANLARTRCRLGRDWYEHMIGEYKTKVKELGGWH